MNNIVENLAPLSGLITAVASGCFAFFRGLPSRHRRAKRDYNLVKELRARDLSGQGPREDLRLEYWCAALSGRWVLGAAEIRHAMSLRPVWKALRDYSLGYPHLALRISNETGATSLIYRHGQARRRFGMFVDVVLYTGACIFGFGPLLLLSHVGISGWRAVFVVLAPLAASMPLILITVRGLASQGAARRIMKMPTGANGAPVATANHVPVISLPVGAKDSSAAAPDDARSQSGELT